MIIGKWIKGSMFKPCSWCNRMKFPGQLRRSRCKTCTKKIQERHKEKVEWLKKIAEEQCGIK